MKYINNMAPKMLYHKMDGFTLVELMISTSVFSVALLICASAVLVLGMDFRKAVIVSLVQNTTRTIVADVTSELQNNAEVPVTGDSSEHSGVTVNVVCIGTTRYSYILGYRLGDVNHVLWKDNARSLGTTCTAVDITVAAVSGTGKELMSPGTRLRATNGFVINDGDNGLYDFDIAVIYGADDVIQSTTKCIANRVGGAFCGVSESHTSVFARKEE